MLLPNVANPILSAVAPNWFAGALAAGLQPLQTQLTTDVARVQTDVEQIQTDVAQIQTDVARISETLIVNQQWSIKVCPYLRLS